MVWTHNRGQCHWQKALSNVNLDGVRPEMPDQLIADSENTPRSYWTELMNITAFGAAGLSIMTRPLLVNGLKWHVVFICCCCFSYEPQISINKKWTAARKSITTMEPTLFHENGYWKGIGSVVTNSSQCHLWLYMSVVLWSCFRP